LQHSIRGFAPFLLNRLKNGRTVSLYARSRQFPKAHCTGPPHEASPAEDAGGGGLASRPTSAVPSPEGGRGAPAAQTDGVRDEAKRQGGAHLRVCRRAEAAIRGHLCQAT